jgi:hypothetical protein
VLTALVCRGGVKSNVYAYKSSTAAHSAELLSAALMQRAGIVSADRRSRLHLVSCCIIHMRIIGIIA